MRTALLVVDYQVDFASPSGALYVPGGELLGPKIEALAEVYSPIVLTQDWHVPADLSFKRQGGRWPEHCVAGTRGAELADIPRTIERAVAIVRKRVNSAVWGTGLAGLLKDLSVDMVDVCGLALEYCVRETALDLRGQGVDVRVILDATQPVDPNTTHLVLDEFMRAGIEAI